MLLKSFLGAISWFMLCARAVSAARYWRCVATCKETAMVSMKHRARILALAAAAYSIGGLAVSSLRAYAAEPQGPMCASHSQSRICYSPGCYPHVLMPGGRREVVRSMLNIANPLHFGNFVWNDADIPRGIVWVRIDLRRQLLSVFREGHEIGSSVIVYGSDAKPTPTGSFIILEKDAHHYSSSYRAPMPYSLRLTNDGVAIHGSLVREGWASHGCIGVPLEFARLLFGPAKKGRFGLYHPLAVVLRHNLVFPHQLGLTSVEIKAFCF